MPEKEYIERVKVLAVVDDTVRNIKVPEYMSGWASRIVKAITEDIKDNLGEIPAADVVPREKIEEKLNYLRSRCIKGVEKDFDKGMYGRLKIVSIKDRIINNKVCENAKNKWGGLTMPEKEYIERKKLLDTLNEEKIPYDSDINYFITTIPAADVRENIKSKWIEFPKCLKYKNAYSEDFIICPKCEVGFNILDNDTERFNFCPNCGADMRGKNDG